MISKYYLFIYVGLPIQAFYIENYLPESSIVHQLYRRKPLLNIGFTKSKMETIESFLGTFDKDSLNCNTLFFKIWLALSIKRIYFILQSVIPNHDKEKVLIELSLIKEAAQRIHSKITSKL